MRELVGDSYRLAHDRAAARRGMAVRAMDTLAPETTEQELCLRVAESIAADGEAPFAMLYRLDREGREARLSGCVGIEPDTRWSPRFVALDSAEPWPIDHVVATGESVELGQLEARFGRRPEGVGPGVRGLKLVPVRAGATERVRGVLVVPIF